ncbi:MAG: ATP-binding protein [Beijerinckiaceae bacterium]|nr:ATP-binding protein [Beijerinckiaceae bacterium]
MAGADSAQASARAGAIRGLACTAARPGALRLAHYEIWVRRAVPAMAALFAAALIAITFVLTSDAYDRAVEGAFTDLELTAGIVTGNLKDALRDAPGADPAGALAQAAPPGALARGQQFTVTGASGSIAASLPSLSGSTSTLNDYLGPAQPLTVFAEKAGVLRINLADGTDCLAAVRTLDPPYGQVAVIYPLAAALAEWQAEAFRAAIILIATVFVLSALAFAYFWQASRARESNSLCERMQSRVDTALSRGRCGLWDWDLSRGRIYWSDSMYEILGMTSAGPFLSFGDINALIHPQDGDLAMMAELLASSQINSIDHAFRMQNVKGDWIWLRARAELVREPPFGSAHLIGIAVDITEQKALAERTATADLRLRDAIEAVSEAFVLWDANNRLVMCNSKFQKFHHLPPDALIAGTPYAQIMAKGAPPVIQSQIPLGERPLAGARTYEARLGDGRWLQINERRTKDGGYVSVGTDITALKRHEEQLMDSERRLTATVTDLRKSKQTLELQAKQLADLADKYLVQKGEAAAANQAKFAFLANMSHELRTPLNHIIGFADMMLQETFGELGSPKYNTYCRDIKESGQYLLGAISNVLDMSRLESGVTLTKSDFEIDLAIRAGIASVKTIAAEKEIMLHAETLPNTQIHADRAAIEKVLTILLRNAVKYTPNRGRVTIRSRSVQGAFNIYVEDTGMGIPKALVARLGHPFEQRDGALDNGMKGSGLGLAIVRSLVELHGGSLRIRSSLGNGTIVLVHLPGPRDTPQLKLKLAANALRRPAQPQLLRASAR